MGNGHFTAYELFTGRTTEKGKIRYMISILEQSLDVSNAEWFAVLLTESWHFISGAMNFFFTFRYFWKSGDFYLNWESWIWMSKQTGTVGVKD